MRHMALLYTQHRVLLILSLIGSFLLTGCASQFEKSYKPAVTAYGSPVTPPAAPPLTRSRDPVLLWSSDASRDGKRLAQEGFVLIGTSSYSGAIDLAYAMDAVAQGKKVGASVVLLNVDFITASHYVAAGSLMDEYRTAGCSPLSAWDVSPWSAGACFAFANGTGPAFGPIGTTGAVFASYWAKADHAER